MVFCKKCGGVVPNDSAFCNRCGEPVAGRNNQRQQVYEGNMHKCPNCGEIVGSFMAYCPLCGFEFRDTQASSAVRLFAQQLQQIESQRIQDLNLYDTNRNLKKVYDKSTTKQIINLIKNFPIPNTKEDMYEFMLLAASNIDDSVYVGNHDSSEITLSNAWKAIAEQVYNKAKISFGKSQDFINIKNIYDTKMKAVNKTKRSGYTVIFIPLIMFLVSFGGLHYMSYMDKKEEKELEESLNATVVEIQADLDNERFDSALVKANSLIFDERIDKEKSKKWNERRKELVKEITDLKIQKSREETTIPPEKSIVKMSESSKDYKGDNYKDVQKRLEADGFYFINTEQLEDIIIGLTTDEGDVEKVSINGVTKFKKGDEFPADADVVITYHTKKGD